MGKPRTIRSEKAHQTGISRIMKTSMHCDPNLSKSQSLGLCDLADAQGFRASAEPPWRLRALLGTPTWVQLHLGIERHILNKRNDRRKSHDMFFHSLQSFIHVSLQSFIHVQSCKTLYTSTYRSKAKEKQNKSWKTRKFMFSLRGARVAAKRLRKLVKATDRAWGYHWTLEMEDMWRIWWFHPDRFCANCNLKQDLSDFTPALVMGES